MEHTTNSDGVGKNTQLYFGCPISNVGSNGTETQAVSDTEVRYIFVYWHGCMRIKQKSREVRYIFHHCVDATYLCTNTTGVLHGGC